MPGLNTASGFVGFLTSAQVAIVLWFAAMAFFVLRGRPLEAIAVFMVSGVWIANQTLGFAVDRPVALVGATGEIDFSRADSGSFPSGHVTGAVVFYGLLAFLALSNVRRGSARVWVPGLAFVVIGAASLSRVYVGAHWPSDILGSYLLGFLGVAGIAWLYTSVKEDSFHLPRLRAKRPDPIVNGVRIARSIASKVYLDFNAGTATKEYSPPLPVKLLYWVAFQAPFPYRGRRDALEAAAAKRKIAGLLTKHQYGRDMVAPVYEIRNGGSSYQLVSELVPGSEPASNREIEHTLSDMYSYFQETGLPTWQIAPANPHAYSNFIRTPEGELKLIDLESALVSTSYPLRELLPALRDGNFPAFDDVDFVRLRGYVGANATSLGASLGVAGLDELNEAIDVAEAASITWKQSEPRIWGRVGRRIYRFFDMSGPINAIGRRLDGAEVMATDFLRAAVDRWESEGRVDGVEAICLRERLGTSEIASLLKHLGAHLVISLLLRFPFGSLARFGWVLAFRLKARSDLTNGRITREEYAEARSVHTVPVMLISLIPGLGTVAYFASGTVRRSGLAGMLLDQFAYKLPFHLYRRMGLARITARRIPSCS